MSDNLSVITLKLDQLADKQERTDEKVSTLTKRVLNPESGVFAKVQANDIYISRNREDIEDLHESVDKLLHICEENSKNFTKIENWATLHEERDDSLRDSVKELANLIKDHVSSAETRYQDQEKELRPIKDDFTVRNSNKKWKDKLIWTIVGLILTGILFPPVVNMYKDYFTPKQTIEKSLQKSLKTK